MGRKISILTLSVCAVILWVNISLAQVLLWDDVGGSTAGYWDYFFDTLITYGVEICSVSSEGWTNIMDMDAVWLQCPDSNSYPTDIREILIEYARNNGRIIMGEWQELSPRIHRTALHPLLIDPRWQTTMEITDTFPMGGLGTAYFDDILPFLPFTDGISVIGLGDVSVITCGTHAYPIVCADSTCTTAVVAISYPFLHEGNCTTYTVLIINGEELDSNEAFWGGGEDIIQFCKNIFLSAAGVSGYELEPGAIPGGGNACSLMTEQYLCSHSPNPFTPNSDDINDFTQFEFDNMGNSEGTIYIYNIHGHEVRQINVPAGANAKTAAQWYGTDNCGNPLPQGVYVYVIESGGEIVCEGTVTLAR